MAIYVDDILTWSRTIDELCENLEKIFKAIKSKGLVLNPAKCEFGMTEVEFVGHLVDKNGVTFTTEKLNQVANMPLPDNQSALKSFLGLGSFFRNHIENYAEKAHSLGELLGDYKKNSKKILIWTDKLQEQYFALQKAIVGCRKLSYVVPGAPIRVYTDASDYGIGAYLCQVLPNGQEVPIEFISKTLTKVERRWSTFEQEAYAIFYALRKWEHHLKDIRFTLFTDQKKI